MQCSSCSSRDIYLDEAGGQFTCTQCGLVLEENTIVSSIEFQETGDRSHVIGRHVSYAAAMSNTGGIYSGGYGSGNSRENTLAKARIKIKAVADSVGNLVSTDIDMVSMAHQYYKLALNKNFLSGRKSEHVAVACLYLVCRKNKTDHLLIDFSDSTQCNVYYLGRVFIQLIQTLQENELPIIDPSLFIHRYAKKLQIEDKLMKPVMISALRIITRMKKDWITTGRRPDGVCAAAMLLSTRAHGIEKQTDEIAKLFRVSTETLRFRLKEFAQTPVAKLSLDDFRNMPDKTYEDLNESWEQLDPPIYRKQQAALLAGEGQNEDDLGSETKETSNILGTLRAKAFNELYEEIYREIRDSEYVDSNELLVDGDSFSDPSRRKLRARRSDEEEGILNHDYRTDDIEVDDCLLGNEERDKRTSVWESEYRGILNAREAQKLIREAEELAKGSRLTKRGKKRKTHERRDGQQSAREAVEEVLCSSSRKINYDAMGETFREDGSFRSPEEVKAALAEIATASMITVDIPQQNELETIPEEGLNVAEENGDQDGKEEEDEEVEEYAQDEDGVVVEEEYDFEYYD